MLPLGSSKPLGLGLRYDYLSTSTSPFNFTNHDTLRSPISLIATPIGAVDYLQLFTPG